MSVDANAPANAAGITSTAMPANSAASAPTAAPPEMPSTYGSASGLRSSTCISAPATASNPPTANPASARGRRNSRTIAARLSVGAASERLEDRSRVDVHASRCQRDREGRERRQDKRAQHDESTRAGPGVQAWQR